MRADSFLWLQLLLRVVSWNAEQTCSAPSDGRLCRDHTSGQVYANGRNAKSENCHDLIPILLSEQKMRADDVKNIRPIDII